MRKFLKKAVAAAVSTAMVATLFVGTKAVTDVKAADNLLTGEWIHTHKNYEANDALIASTRVKENDEGGFTANITMTGWQREWRGVEYQPEDAWLCAGGWCDNPYQLNSAIEMDVQPLSTYELKFDVDNKMTNDQNNPTEKNITVTVNSGIEGDSDNTLLFTTVRVAPNGSLTFDRKFTVGPDNQLDKVKIQIAYGAYAYSYEISGTPFLNMMPQELRDKYVFAPGTNEGVNAKGVLDFKNIEVTQVPYEEPTTKAPVKEEVTTPAAVVSGCTCDKNAAGTTAVNGCTCDKNVTPTSNTTPEKVTKPGKPSISAKNVKGKKIQVTWKKVNGATKYQVKAVQGKKNITKTTTKVKYTLKGLKKKTYKVSVRAYNSAGYGKWSKVKKVKITK